MVEKEYIEKRALIEAWERERADATDLYDAFDFALEDVPAADVAEVVHGEWKFVDVLPMHGAIYECTNCKERYTDQALRMRYCPDCGAKMDGWKDG